jgi:hypothetical protein
MNHTCPGPESQELTSGPVIGVSRKDERDQSRHSAFLRLTFPPQDKAGQKLVTILAS